MTDPLPSARSTSSAGRTRRGGILLLVAGLLQLAGAAVVVGQLAGVLIPPIVQITAWGVGGLLLLPAVLVLSADPRLQPGARSVTGRIAAFVFGASGLLDLAVIVIALTAAAGRGASITALATEHGIVFAASAMIAARVLRAPTLPAVARGGLIAIALVDGITFCLAVTSETGAVFLLGTYALRPMLLAIAGAALGLRGSRDRAEPERR